MDYDSVSSIVLLTIIVIGILGWLPQEYEESVRASSGSILAVLASRGDGRRATILGWSDHAAERGEHEAGG